MRLDSAAETLGQKVGRYSRFWFWQNCLKLLVEERLATKNFVSSSCLSESEKKISVSVANQNNKIFAGFSNASTIFVALLQSQLLWITHPRVVNFFPLPIL